jgi:LysR family transcriptional regulator, regulator for genes of the gallate degradation pathway
MNICNKNAMVLVNNMLGYTMSDNNFGIPEISLRHLKSALYVAECKNVTHAANKLNRSQTAVTKSISELEATLGIQLFDRASTGMMPTVYGDVLAHRVRLAVDEFAKAGLAYQEFKPEGRNYQSIPVFSLDISYKRLAAFVALYEKRDVTSAAQALGITKTAVYNSVRQMEEYLELSLFEREPRGVAPTGLATVLVRHIKLAFSQIRHALEDIANLDGVTRGSVLIGTLPYTRTYLTPVAINRLLESYPQLDVATREGPYNELESSLRSGDVDFIVGAIRSVEDRADIVTEQLFEDRLSVIARKKHPLASEAKINFKEMQNVQWVLPARETPTRQLFDEMLSRYEMHVPEHAVETSSLSMVRGLLMDSNRVALLSEHQIYYDKLAGLLDVLPVDLEDTYRPIGVTMRAHTRPSPAAELFLTQLREVAAEIHS